MILHSVKVVLVSEEARNFQALASVQPASVELVSKITFRHATIRHADLKWQFKVTDKHFGVLDALTRTLQYFSTTLKITASNMDNNVAYPDYQLDEVAELLLNFAARVLAQVVPPEPAEAATQTTLQLFDLARAGLCRPFQLQPEDDFNNTEDDSLEDEMLQLIEWLAELKRLGHLRDLENFNKLAKVVRKWIGDFCDVCQVFLTFVYPIWTTTQRLGRFDNAVVAAAKEKLAEWLLEQSTTPRLTAETLPSPAFQFQPVEARN